MTSKKTLATSLASLSTGLMLALSVAGGATAAPAKSQDSDPLQVTSTVVSNSPTDQYWTPERMRAAVPGDVLADKAVARQINQGPSATADVAETGTSTEIAGTTAQVTLQALHANVAPIAHIGKVFFTMAGANYVCSGNSVIADNKSTVSTAGHCVNEGPGAFATNFVFVPGYVNGTAPYGKWPARKLYAPSQWSKLGNIQYDTGFAIVSKVNGESLSDVVGASGVQFNQAREMTYMSFGYPAAVPFTGQTLVSCTGKAGTDSINPQFKTQGIPCDMTGGSSGGPWFVQGGTDADRDSNGFQNSINSYGYGTQSTTMFGPYWGKTIEKVYQNASSA
ncbi:hypothetical protein B1A87_012710 [Arthrobacter sp. KBS0703]|nr:hypothetical protein B1A87_012710 [Arthrobacter sp. KBS0703]